jgi:hypothetical protein
MSVIYFFTLTNNFNVNRPYKEQNIVKDLINAWPGNGTVNMVQRAATEQRANKLAG